MGTAFPVMPSLTARVAALLLLAGVLLWANPARADFDRFVGEYVGAATLELADGTTQHRNMSVDIVENKKGFSVSWTTVTHKPDGRTKEKSYSLDFLPSDREGIYSAAMKANVFGHMVQLDPMKGEPYVWGRIIGDTLSIYSLFVDSEGGYEIQQYDRTLAEGGLMLEYKSVRNGETQTTITTFLKKN